MIGRATFFLLAAFWVTMNVLLWRTEYSPGGGHISIPVDLVWRKILTAPDTSSLNVYQNGQRTGFFEFSTSVEQAMANLDEDNPPPEGIVARAGYQIHVNGNMSFGEFTNRVRFDGRMKFSHTRAWRELDLKFSTRFASVNIHSVATNQTIVLEITNDGETVQRVLTFADLQNPTALLRSFTGDFAGGILDDFALPAQNSTTLAQTIHWQARRDHLPIGHELASVYRLEARALEYQIVIYVSPLGEILRIELPNGITASLDE
ncbi:MAG TPA: hypothetical protein VIK59_04530 [Verrucomicrobiae bacterium]